MKKKKLILSGLLIFLFVFFVLPLIGYGILQWKILPPEKLTPLVVQKTNEFIEAHLECEKVELTYFETYPYLGVRLTNGRLISHHFGNDSIPTSEELEVPADSLLSFKRITLAFNPNDYLLRKQVTIKWLSIEQPHFHAFVNAKGQANWEIYHSESDSLKQEEKPAAISSIDLQKIHITEGHFCYNNLQQGVYTEIDNLFLHINGSLTQGENRLNVEAGLSSLQFKSPSYSLSHHLAMDFKSRLLLADAYKSITLKDTELKVNNLPFKVEGTLNRQPELNQQQMDFTFGLQVSDLNDLLHFIPDAYFKNRDQVTAQGKILLDGSIHGCLGDSIAPTVDMSCRVLEGAYHAEGMKQGIDTLLMDMNLHLNGEHIDSSHLSVKQLEVIGPNIALHLKGDVQNLFLNPTVQAELNSQINFTRLGQQFLNPDTLQIEGDMDANLQMQFTVDDLINSRFGKITSKGMLKVNQFKAYSRPFDFDMYLTGANLIMEETKDENEYINSKGLLQASMDLDSMNLRYQDEVNTNVSHFRMIAKTARIIDTTAIIPLTTRIEFDKLWTRLPDSIWIAAGKTLARGGIKASGLHKKIPTLGVAIQVDTLKYFLVPQRTGIVMAGNNLTMEALPYREALQKASGQPAASMQPATQPAVQEEPTADSNQFLRHWEVRGKIGFSELKSFSQFFPLPIRMDKTEMSYNTHNVSLNKACLHLGNSDLLLDGEIYQIRQALLNKGKLKGHFDLQSNYIDCNQLMLAANKGMQLSDQLTASSDALFNEDSLAQMSVEPMLTGDTLATDTTSQLFVVPDFLDLTFRMDAKQIDFKEVKLKETTGTVVIRDKSINLNNLQMNSNIGSGHLTMVYSTPTSQKATMGIELGMNQILVNKLINLFPAIDTLVPMLRSFEGVVNCQMLATCQTDSTTSLILPSIHASCQMSGKNMVLLDGETFAEISKTLMFKNKKRNMIDSIAVDLAIKDNKINVFPFLVEMDRYKVAVGGTHNLDMTFDYHLSVLKSPVPFKLGIDIKGNLDDFKFKIVKCRYKDFLKPAKQSELEDNRRSIRKDIQENIRKQMKEAAPELENSLLPIVSADSLQLHRSHSILNDSSTFAHNTSYTHLR